MDRVFLIEFSVNYGLPELAIRPQLSGQPWSQARGYSDAALRSVIGPLLPRNRIGSSSSGGGAVASRLSLVRLARLTHAG